MPFQKGQSGNPGGRPKTKPFKEALERVIRDTDTVDSQTLDEVARALYTKAKAGDVQAIKEVADRLDGKVPQGHGGDDELPPFSMIVTGVPRAGD